MAQVRTFHVAKSLPSDGARLEAALEVVMRLHADWPADPNHDILCFLTGQVQSSIFFAIGLCNPIAVHAEWPAGPNRGVLAA